MPMDYIPKAGPSVVSYIRKPKFTREDIKIDDIPIIDPADHNVCSDHPGKCEQDNLLTETLDYSPSIGNYSSPIAKNSDTDITNINQENPADTSLLKTSEDFEKPDILSDEEDPTDVPSDLVDYFSESTKEIHHTAECGLPRLNMYPMKTVSEVYRAIAGLKHCRDPKDRQTLQENIVNRCKELHIDYQEKQTPLSESVFEKPMSKRSADEIKADHQKMNNYLYNHIFYSDEYVKEVQMMEQYQFLRYFYPNMKTHNFYTHLQVSLGTLGTDKMLYEKLGIRYPLETDFTKPIGWNILAIQLDELKLYIDANYEAYSNWFHENLCYDLDHIIYCLRLYSIMGEILNDPNFRMDMLNEYHIGILLDWGQRVQYHYDQLKNYPEKSKGYYKELQYLFDLFWNPADNPEDEAAILSCVLSTVDHMAAGSILSNINEGTDLITREDCRKYLVHELGNSDDLYLIPELMQYPIIDKMSVKLAMDQIRTIEKEYPNELSTYVTNLNRKYKELGCTFSITVDHPYAKYADSAIIDHMNRILMEGETAVDDHGTSAGTASYAETPWVIRNDITGTVGRNLLANKELGPNDGKKTTELDYERIDSML